MPFLHNCEVCGRRISFPHRLNRWTFAICRRGCEDIINVFEVDSKDEKLDLKGLDRWLKNKIKWKRKK